MLFQQIIITLVIKFFFLFVKVDLLDFTDYKPLLFHYVYLNGRNTSDNCNRQSETAVSNLFKIKRYRKYEKLIYIIFLGGFQSLLCILTLLVEHIESYFQNAIETLVQNSIIQSSQSNRQSCQSVHQPQAGCLGETNHLFPLVLIYI